MPTKIFISHSWQDKKFVELLEAELRGRGAEVWVDHREIRAGDNLPDEISNALQWCDALLLIWSQASKDSYWVKLEWTNALTLKKKIIPCVLDPSPLPSILSHKVHVQMKGAKETASETLSALNITDPQLEQPNGGKEATAWTQQIATSFNYHKVKYAVQWLLAGLKRIASPRVVLLTIAAAIALVLLLKYAPWKFFGGQKANDPQSNSLASDHRRIILVFLDISQSVKRDQSQLAAYANTILDDMPEGTRFEVFTLAGARFESLIRGEIATQSADAALERGFYQQKVQTASDRVPETAKDFTCIFAAMSYADNYFAQFGPSSNFELVFLSDMKENCGEDQNGHTLAVEIEKLPLLKHAAKARVTMILPGQTSAIPVTNFWKRALKKYGFPAELLEDRNWFFVSNSYPPRFTLMKLQEQINPSP